MNYKYITLIIIGCVFFLSINFSGAINSSIDFAPIYYSSQILFDGGNIYDNDLLKEIIINNGHSNTAIHYLYPPFVSALAQPLGQLPLRVALTMWLLINTIALILGFGILINTFIPDKIKYYLIVLGCCLIFYPVIFNLLLGQINPIVLLLLSGGLVLLLKQKNTGSGILIGIASLIKVFPIIFLIYALFIKKFKVFFSGILTIFAGILLTCLLSGSAGLANSIEYFSSVLPSIFSGNLLGWSPGNSSPGFLDILWTTAQSATILSIATKIFITIFFVFIGYKYLIRKQIIDRKSIILEYSFLATILVIASAFSFHHYLLWLVIPFIVLFYIYLNNRNKYFLISLLFAFLLSAIPPLFIEVLLPTNINDSIYPFINPGLWSVVMVLVIIISQYFNKSLQNR
ncbi:DUF2029 domain-containing protein [Patescibacteria group bacterium]|nr:DUF2029 domain-containing protein [Patescibacteria group bacterium]MBU1075352.1 DUF2029 domain-containing protein [Patescibacteria group bacterium]MBU1951715.1 DUF2029 domain-containing protein [Patescibacteria group bacterium]